LKSTASRTRERITDELAQRSIRSATRDDVAAALDAAAERWPDARSRRELLLRLIGQGREVIERDRGDAATAPAPAPGDPSDERCSDRRLRARVSRAAPRRLAGVILVDASVLIAHLDERDALHDRAEEALLEAAAQPLGCSPSTLAEVLVGPAGRAQLDAARNALAQLEVSEVPLGEGAGLKMPDCWVLLAAGDVDAVAVLTFDDALARAAERLGVRAV
jgi:predicted nucleic acid-binding protein